MTKPERTTEFSPSLDRSGRGWLARMQAQSQIEFDIEFYQRILERNPRFVDVLRCQGELLTHQGHHLRALEIDRQLAVLRPHDCIIRYNLACSLALAGRLNDSLDELAQALEHGYDDFDHLECDRDLDAIRELPAFAELVQRFAEE